MEDSFIVIKDHCSQKPGCPGIDNTKIATGVFWVESPEAELYVLCGCPADSVKHLMKGGKIRDIYRDSDSLEPGSGSFQHHHGTVTNELVRMLFYSPI
ncbi:MAG: hypothetical protein Ct9H300mP21_10130 [Pseudomonadota bacterium]|nr:MAG: hypothetical protein Ct9H300mP21_10130 [Pseudomonadota bacterium]